MKTRKQKVLSYILAPILGAGVAAGCIVPAILAKPSKWVDEDTIPTVEVDETTKQEGVSIKDSSKVRINKESTIDLGLPEAKQIGKVEIKIDGKVISEDDYTIDQETNKITIKASAMKGTNIVISINTEDPIEYIFNSQYATEETHVIRRNSSSSFKFKLNEEYTNPTIGTGSTIVDKDEKIISLDDDMFEKDSGANNIHTFKFKSSVQSKLKDAVQVNIVINAEPVSPTEKKANVEYDGTFAAEQLTIRCTPSITESQNTIEIEYDAVAKVAGTIKASNKSGDVVASIKHTFESGSGSVDLTIDDWSKIEDESTITLSFKKDQVSKKQQFINKANEWNDTFLSETKEYIAENISISRIGGEALDIHQINYHDEDWNKKAVLITSGGVVTIAGDYSGDELNSYLKEESSDIVYEITDNYISYVNNNPKSSDLVECKINNGGYIEKINWPEMSLEYEVQYNSEPQEPIVTKFNEDIDYGRGAYKGRPANKISLVVAGNINNSRCISDLELGTHYKLKADDQSNDVTEQVLEGTFKFNDTDTQTFFVASDTGIVQEFTIELKDSSQEKVATTNPDTKVFEDAGITITSITNSVYESEGIISIGYTVQSDVKGTIILEGENGLWKYVPVSFKKDGDPIEIVLNDNDWGNIFQDDTISIHFEADEDPVKTNFLDKADEFYEEFQNNKLQYNKEQIQITDPSGQALTTTGLNYSYNGAGKKDFAGLGIKRSEELIDTECIGGYQFSKDSIRDQIKNPKEGVVTYECTDEYIYYKDTGADPENWEIKELKINKYGHVEKYIRADSESDSGYIITYSTQPQEAKVTNFSKAAYNSTGVYHGDTFSIDKLSVSGFINGSEYESNLTFNVHYDIYQGDTKITEQIKSGSYVFENFGTYTFKVVSKDDSSKYLEFNVEVGERITKKVYIYVDRDIFEQAGIIVGTYDGSVDWPYTFRFYDYTLTSGSVTGTVTLTPEKSSNPITRHVTFNGSTVYIEFTTDEWKGFTNNERLNITFQKD